MGYLFGDEFFGFSWTDIAPKWKYHGINWDISRIFEPEKWHHIGDTMGLSGG